MYSRGLGALIAEKFAAEGCRIAINYVSNLERARETAVKIEELESYEKKVVLVQGVCTIQYFRSALHLYPNFQPSLPIQREMIDLETIIILSMREGFFIYFFMDMYRCQFEN